VYQCTSVFVARNDPAAIVSAPTQSNSPVARPSCAASDITIKSSKARFVSECSARSPCYGLKGVAVLVNNCSEPIGVQVKITGLDKDGNPVATRNLWPASIRNIPPGEYTFSLDTWLDYDPSIKTFQLAPIDVKRWR
jgi:hypothetical protein